MGWSTVDRLIQRSFLRLTVPGRRVEVTLRGARPNENISNELVIIAIRSRALPDQQ